MDVQAAAREIREPYPGLRPFLDHEQSLLKGRDEQIQQVVDRLADSHFVAIIGGSGSGKSSLIRAGVVPALRAHAIEKAGDYWAPVVFTPGTVRGAAAAGANPAPTDETPVTRLAWKFAQVMSGPGPGAAVNASLAAEVTAFLRQGAGFGRLVKAYHDALPRPGPPTERARFLFVIDQFEELFHPHNRGNPDARTIVDALIEHFLNPDPRCYVVMTMRSEHLSDCAAYLHLPEAINRSFYLVRRLNQGELRQVITEPAQVMALQLRRRREAADFEAADRKASEVETGSIGANAAEAGGPADQASASPAVSQVEFDRQAVARMLADVRQIEDDPDHLPLLQHLLARCWAAALQREHAHRVPSRITWADLQAAVDPGGAQAANWLEANRQINTLRSSLQNWAEHQYLRRDDAGRQQLDQLLSRLAYKDPTNGLYFQQRLQVDDPTLLAGIAAPREPLLALLQDGFLDTVNYLYWDDDNPEHITLKVSHEAFIRGWQRFRDQVDREADRFDEFVAVIRKTSQWDEGGRPTALLLGEPELARLQAADLTPVLDEPARFDNWLSVLRLYRQDKRLDRAAAALPAFLAASRELLDRQRRQAEAVAKAVADAVEEKRQADERAKVTAARADAERQAAEAREREQQAQVAQAEAEAARARADHALVQEHRRAGDAQARRKRARLWAGLGVLAVFTFFVLLLALHGLLIRDPATDIAMQYLGAQRETSQRAMSNASPEPGAAQAELRTLRQATYKVLQARNGPAIDAFFLRIWSAVGLRDKVAGLPLVGEWLTAKQLVQAESASSESPVHEALRGLLASAPWETSQAAGSTALPALLKGGRSCRIDAAGSAFARQADGTQLFAGGSRLGLFIPDEVQSANAPPPLDIVAPRPPLVIYNARLDGDVCSAYRVAFSTSRDLSPALLFESRGAVMGLLNRQDISGARLTLQLFDLVWSADQQDGSMVVRFMPRREIRSPDMKPLSDWVNRQPATTELFELATHPIAGGVQLLVPAASSTDPPHRWQMLFSDAQPLPEGVPQRQGPWQRLRAVVRPAGTNGQADGPAARCERQRQVMAQKLKTTYGLSAEAVSAWATEKPLHCIIAIGMDARGGKPGPSPGPSVQLGISVYQDMTLRAAYGDGGALAEPRFTPAPISSWLYTNQLPGTQRAWWIGSPGTASEGWLATTPAPAPGQPARPPAAGDLASPFSSQALINLADGMLKDRP